MKSHVYLSTDVTNKYRLRLFLLSLIVMLGTSTSYAQQSSYEAENGTVSNGGQISNCSSCSGGKLVGYLGGNTNGAVTIPVQVTTAGKYVLKVFYAGGDPRTIAVSVNNASSRPIACEASGGWETVSAAALTVQLNAGANNIRLDNSSGWAPNIDKITITPLRSWSIAFGGANRILCDTASGLIDVYYNNERIIGDAYTIGYNNGIAYSSIQYSRRTVDSNAILDSLGAGRRYIIKHTGNGLPTIQQIFYVYPHLPYFLTEIVMGGTSLKSNKMVPLIASFVNLPGSVNVYNLFVPFDNDTFISYNAKSMSTAQTNTSAEIGVVYDNVTRKGLFTGSVEHNTWKTGIRSNGQGNQLSEWTVWGGYAEEQVTRDKKPHGSISGNSIRSPKVMVGYVSDWRQGLEAFANVNRQTTPRYLPNWTGGTPFGWNSWGEMKTNLTLAKANAVADFFATQLPVFRSDSTAFIDLDSYWDNLAPGGITGDFSQLTQFANYCKSKGLQPGIYWAPFVDWGKFDRQLEGSSFNYQDTWLKQNGQYHDLDGCRAMDPTHPGTRQRLAYLIGKFKACGFKMIKIDFLGHAAIEADAFYDPTVTTGMQAYKKGMEYLVDQLGGQMLVYAAISPSMASMPYVHMRRIACDAESNIGASAYTLNSTNYGWWQSLMYNYIDADHLVFRNETEGTNRARLASGIVTGSLITGDDYSAPNASLVDRSQRLLQNTRLLNIAKQGNGKAFKPVDGNTGTQPGELYVRRIGDDYYLAVFNFTQAAKQYNISLDRIGWPGSYVARELFRDSVYTANGNLKVTIPAADAGIFRFELPSHREDTTNTARTMVTLQKEETAGVSLYPNPAKDRITIRNSTTISSIRCVDMKGNVMKEVRNINDMQYQLDISAYQPAMYILLINDRTGKNRTYKFIKQ